MDLDFPGAEFFFVFADYLHWSWAYAIRLSKRPAEECSVVLIGKQFPITVASSFEEFVNLYIADSPKLYGLSGFTSST